MAFSMWHLTPCICVAVLHPDGCSSWSRVRTHSLRVCPALRGRRAGERDAGVELGSQHTVRGCAALYTDASVVLSGCVRGRSGGRKGDILSGTQG